MDIPKQLKLLRTSKGLTQQGLSDLLGLEGKTMICRYEQGITVPTLDSLERICSVLDYELTLVPKGLAEMAKVLSESKRAIDQTPIECNPDYKQLLSMMKEIRTSKKISQQSFAESLGVGDKSMISRYEKGGINPTIDRMDEMLNLLGYELAIVPKGYRDFARTVCEEKARMDSNKEKQDD